MLKLANGVLNDDIVPATVCPFLDFNINSQLNRFGMHNGGSQDGALLNEKWEGIALVPVDRKDRTGKSDGDEYFLFASSDNDFVTQNGTSSSTALLVYYSHMHGRLHELWSNPVFRRVRI